VLYTVACMMRSLSRRSSPALDGVSGAVLQLESSRAEAIAGGVFQ